MKTVYQTVMMKPGDNVAVALTNIPAGTVLTVTCQGKSLTIRLADEISFGHKFALRPIGSGEDIIKYGEVIGKAIQDITPGGHVHIHNVEGKRGRGDQVAEGE